MFRILLAGENDALRESLEMVLDNLPFETRVYESASLKNAQNLFESKYPFDLIISEHNYNTMNAAALLLDARKKRDDMPFIVISDMEMADMAELDNLKDGNGNNCILKSIVKTDELKKKVLEFFNEKNKHVFQYEEEAYKRIRITNFLRFNKVLCDIYVKLSDIKYVKIIKKGDTYTRKDLQKYSDRKIKYLYIEEKDFEPFKNKFASTPFLIMDKNLDPEAAEDASISAIEIVHSLVSEMGVTPQVVNLVDFTAYQIIEGVKKESRLKELISEFKERRDYLHDHSYMVAYISNHMCNHLDFDSDEIRRKLTMAAILHDVNLTDPELAMSMDLDLPDLENYSKETIKAAQKHPIEIAQMIREGKELEFDVDDIVAQHHEKPDGTGYPRSMDAKSIGPLVAVFIVAHHFVNELYRHDFDKREFSQIVNHLEKFYVKGNFTLALESLKKSFRHIINILSDKGQLS